MLFLKEQGDARFSDHIDRLLLCFENGDGTFKCHRQHAGFTQLYVIMDGIAPGHAAPPAATVISVADQTQSSSSVSNSNANLTGIFHNKTEKDFVGSYQAEDGGNGLN